MQFLSGTDNLLTALLSGAFPHTAFTRSVFSFFSFAGGSFFIWLIPLVLLIIFEEKKDRRFLLYFAVSSLLSVVLVDYLLKGVFMRTRPYLVWGIQNTGCPHDFSFPSGHAAFSFASATVLSAFDRKRSVWYYLAALLVSYSRIFLYCHYFSDVVAGGVIGYLISTSVLKFHHQYSTSKRKKTVQRRKSI